MSAAVLEAPGRLRVRSFARPSPAANAGVLRVELAGLCGTDLKIYRGEASYPYPLILGHEIVGRIEELGSDMARSSGVRVGDRVVVEPRVPCWSCPDCHRGAYRFCTRRQGYGTATTSDTPPYLWGALSELMYLAPGSVMYSVSDQTPVRAAVLAPTVIANGFEWTRQRGELRNGETIVVLGAGPQGLAQVVVARECNAGLIVMTGLRRDRDRLDLARRLGADLTVCVEDEALESVVRDATRGRMADLVVDVTGSRAAMADALSVLRTQGRLVLAGLVGGGIRIPVEADLLIWKEISLRGAFAQSAPSVAAAVALVESGRYPLEQIVSHVYPLEAADAAIQSLAGDATDYPTKAAIAPNGTA